MSLGRYRALNTLLFIATTLLVVVAALLEPDPNGVGTHVQLGLKPCLFLEYSGLPCPACGWTTSFTLAVRGQLIAAWQTHPFGTILAVTTGLTLIVAASEALVPRHRWSMFHSCFRGRESRLLAVFLVVMFAAWAFKLAQKVIFLSSAA